MSYLAPATPEPEGPMRYWRGEGPLWRLYWIYGVLISTAGGTLIMTATLYHLFSPWLILALVLLGLAYTVWILVSTWRCAFNIEGEPLGDRPDDPRLDGACPHLRLGDQRRRRVPYPPSDRVRRRFDLKVPLQLKHAAAAQVARPCSARVAIDAAGRSRHIKMRRLGSGKGDRA
jgi:hypothetical protein